MVQPDAPNHVRTPASSGPPSGDRRPPLEKRVFLYAALLVTVLLGIEGLSSVALLAKEMRNLRPPPENFRQATYDSLVGWVGIPNLSIRDNYGPNLSLHTNADGMRIHRPVTPALAPGEKRIICSGDSFTFGSGVADSETFCASLEEEFPRVHTLNMSQRGFGNDQAYLWYKRDGGRYPHQVHVFAFIWNDFERMTMKSFLGYAKPLLKLKDGKLVTENVPVPPWKGWSRWSQAGVLLPDLRLVQLMRRHVDNSEATQMRRVDEQVFGVAEALFRDLDHLNTERGSKLVLVYLPAPPDLSPGAYDARRVKLAHFSEQSGIPLVDLTDDIRKVPPDSLDWLFITPNALPTRGSAGHYTAWGHRWIAARLAEHMRRIPAVVSALAPASP